MSLPNHAPSEGQFWLFAYQTAFIHSLITQGYAKSTIQIYRCISRRFCHLAQINSISPEELEADTLANLAEACLTTDTLRMKQKVTAVTNLFFNYLENAGVIVRKDPLPSPGTVDHLAMELDQWLRTQRGQFGNHLKEYPRILRSFVEHCSSGTNTDLIQDLALITPEMVLSFVDKVTLSSNWPIPYLRNILRFLFWSNYTSRDLTAIIPSTSHHRTDNSLPRHLEPETVQRLLDAMPQETARDRRDYAMLLLMARLGLRSQEVRAIKLDDLDWNTGRLLVRGKLGQIDHMPIPVDVGTAIIAWLRNGRRGQVRHLFTSLNTPHAALQTSKMINKALKRAYKLAELPLPPGEVRTHSLRHSLAMKLLHQGSSLEEIGDVLRHRSSGSTTTYARHDVTSLQGLARPWPIKGGENDTDQ